MAETKTGTLDAVLRGELPLENDGKVLSPAKTTVGPSPTTPFGSETIIRGRNGEILMGGNLVRNPNPNKDIESSRIGDYVYDSQGNAQVVPNSYRDLVNKYIVRIGESAKESLNLYDYLSALASGVSAAYGLPTSSDNVGSMLGTAALGQAAKATPQTQWLWSAGNILNSLAASEKAYVDKYLNQDIEYDLGLEFSTDENGNVTAKVDYANHDKAGHGSGSAVKSLTDTDKTAVTLGDDNRLNVTASRSFLESDTYKALQEDLLSNLDGLTKEQANEVVDEDTGRTRLEAISDYVKATESRFYYNAQSIQRFKQIAPAASEESLANACYTQLVGYVGDKSLKEMTITVYNNANEKIEVNAEAWANSINDLKKTGRNDYMNSLASRIQSPDISDDEKVVLQAQANALYALSDSDGKYNGMFKKGLLDTVADASVPMLSKITWNDIGKSLGGYGTLDAFERNDFYAGTVQITNTIANAKAMSAFMNFAEKGLRGVARAAGDGILSDTRLGDALAGIDKYAPQDVPVRVPGSAPAAIYGAEGTKSWGEYFGKTAVQTGAQVAADAVVDALKGATYKALGYEDRFSYLDELKSDILFDALMSYGPRNYVERTKTATYKALDADERIELEDLEGNKTGEVITIPGVKLVVKDADALARKHAERIDKMTDSKIALTTEEILFDKNAAMGKMAAQLRALVGGDNYLYRRLVRLSGPIRQVTEDYHALFNSVYKTEMDAFKKQLSEVAPKYREWTQADRDYINAAANHHRFTQENAGSKEAVKEADEFYRDALNGVSPERKAQLDELLTRGRALAARVLDFYEEYGLISKKGKNELLSKDAYKNGMFFPVWVKAKRIPGGEIAQSRAQLKSVWNKSELIAVKDMEDPLVTLSQYITNAARNVALQERADAIAEAGSVPGMKMHVYADTGAHLRDVENAKELNEEFGKIYDKIVKEVTDNYPTREQWQKENGQMVMRSKAFKLVNDLEKMKEELKKDRAELREAKKALDKDPTNENFQRYLDADTMVNTDKAIQLYIIDQIKDYAKLLMNRAYAKNKSSLKLDMETYLDVTFTNMAKNALNANDITGRFQVILQDAVEKARPYVDREEEIQRQAEDAAVKFRKDVNKRLRIKSGVKRTADEINDLADKITDAIEAKVMGQKPTIRVIDDAEATRILNESGDSHTIRYMIDGVERRFSLTGKGSEQLVKEFYAPEGWMPKTFAGRLLRIALNVSGSIAQGKRILTSSFDVGRVMPNLARDWTRGIVTTGGQILMSPEMIKDYALAASDGSEASTKIIENGFELARQAVDKSTFTASMELPKKNRSKSMIRAANEPDGNAAIRYIYDRTESVAKTLSTLQDAGETFTRSRAMEVAYYSELANSFSKGMSTEEAIKRATEAAYFYGREATTNFFRRGRLIATIARHVPYLSQNFATLESFKFAFLDDPLAATRALQDTTMAYTALIALALSNEESRKKYYLLSEYDRANNIIIPLTNDSIITIPLDETIAGFFTPYRRIVETLAGVDPESFYVIFGETLEALSPFDLSGFSEGDKFNVVRGLEKLGSQIIPTWAQPIVEAVTGRDLYYGSTLRVTQEDVGERTGDWTTGPEAWTTTSKNSQTLATVAEHTGIPQWILQNMLSEYGGSVGQYALNTIDKLAGASEDAQGGKEWSDSIFKPFTGSDSNSVNQAFWDGVSELKREKATLQKELKTIKNEMKSASGDAKAELENKRKKKINEYGTKVSDFLNQYLSAYEITGGLSKSQANQVWYLYKLYDEDGNADMYDTMSTGEYYMNKLSTYNNRRATNLASASGIDQYIDPSVAKADTLAQNVYDPNANYYETYAQQAFMNSVYGDATKNVYRLETAMKDSGLLNNNQMWNGYYEAKAQGKAALKQYKADWNTQVLLTLAPVVEEVGLDTILGSSATLDYFQKYLFDVTNYNRKEYLKKVYGV